ncbi:MAG: hypothetical protein M0Z30_02530 [Actinomycetota bacterium]|nr:hypothetical protein [Actinomycetota bacterium]
MYRFSRQLRLSGSKLTSAMAWANELTENVRSVTALPVNLLTEVYSPGSGTLVWSTMAADLRDIEAGLDKLMVDNRFNELQEGGFAYLLPGTLKDTLRTIVHPTEGPSPIPDFEYVTCTYSTIAAGHLARAIPVGIQIAERVTELTGSLTTFEADATGNYGGVAWIAIAANITAMQEAEGKVTRDPGFIEFVDREASTVFASAPGATTSRILRKLL